MLHFENVSTASPWVKGSTYQIVYKVDHIKLFGVIVPDVLIPNAVRERLAKKQISQVIEKLTNDPRYEIISYDYNGETFSITAIARENPFPIGVVVVAIIGFALIFGIALTTREVSKLVDSADTLVTDVGPVGTTLAIGTVSAIVLVGAFMFLKTRT